MYLIKDNAPSVLPADFPGLEVDGWRYSQIQAKQFKPIPTQTIKEELLVSQSLSQERSLFGLVQWRIHYLKPGQAELYEASHTFA